MVIRVHEADSNGPIAGSGEVFRGGALDVVQGMMLNPFNASLRPVEYMRKTLKAIGRAPWRFRRTPRRQRPCLSAC